LVQGNCISERGEQFGEIAVVPGGLHAGTVQRPERRERYDLPARRRRGGSRTRWIMRLVGTGCRFPWMMRRRPQSDQRFACPRFMRPTPGSCDVASRIVRQLAGDQRRVPNSESVLAYARCFRRRLVGGGPQGRQGAAPCNRLGQNGSLDRARSRSVTSLPRPATLTAGIPRAKTSRPR